MPWPVSGNVDFKRVPSIPREERLTGPKLFIPATCLPEHLLFFWASRGAKGHPSPRRQHFICILTTCCWQDSVCPLGTAIKTTLRPLFWELQNNSSPAPCRVLISTIMSFNEVSSPLDPSSWLLSDCSVLWDFSEHTRDLHDALLLLEWFCNARGLSIPATSKHVFRVPVAREAEHGGLPAVCTASRQGCSVSRSLAAGCMSPLAENRQWPKNDMVSSGAMYYFAVCISFPPLI